MCSNGCFVYQLNSRSSNYRRLFTIFAGRFAYVVLAAVIFRQGPNFLQKFKCHFQNENQQNVWSQFNFVLFISWMYSVSKSSLIDLDWALLSDRYCSFARVALISLKWSLCTCTHIIFILTPSAYVKMFWKELKNNTNVCQIR